MTDSNSLSLPQFCSPEQQRARAKEVGSACCAYEFNHDWTAYPPTIEEIPTREASDEDKREIDVGFGEGLVAKIAGQLVRCLAYKANPFEKKVLFGNYTALYKKNALPAIADNDQWQLDAVYSLQKLNGMFPWFIEKVKNLVEFRQSFGIDDNAIDGLLPPNQTLASLAEAGRIYFISQASLNGAQPANGQVMTAPTTLFFVNDLGQLMPLGIQLYPQHSETNPVFTPNDDQNTWLAMKIHASCADTLVYSLYNHAVLIHFVMSSVWVSANRTLPTEHPLYAFLKPHFWMTLYVTNQVKNSMDKPKGQQLKVLGISLEGQNQMVSTLQQGFDFGNYKPSYDFEKRGVNDESQLPNYYFRDDSLRLWSADRDYVESMMNLFYSSDADVVNDYELQDWMAELASKEGAGLKGLPVNAEGKIVSREDLYDFLASILFTVTSKHSSIVNSALQYGYVPANPSIYSLPAPQNPGAVVDAKTVADCLPPIPKAIYGRALIASAAHFVPPEINILGHYPDGFTDGWPTGAAENVAVWQKTLAEIDSAIDSRNQRLVYPYTAMKPTLTFNSIFN